MRKQRGFTLVELLVMLGVVAILAAIFVPAWLSARETARRTRCLDHLNDLGRAFERYLEANGYRYPSTPADPARPEVWTAFTGVRDDDPFAGAGVEPNDVTASLWLLVRTGVVTDPRAFVCPSLGGVADEAKDRALRGNFHGPSALGYGYATPFGRAAGYELNDTLPGGFAVMADRGRAAARPPAAADAPFALARANSANHGGAGQNVLYSTGAAHFRRSPYVGVGFDEAAPASVVASSQPATQPTGAKGPHGDHIYTALAAEPLTAEVPHDLPGAPATRNVGPAYRYDSVLVP